LGHGEKQILYLGIQASGLLAQNHALMHLNHVTKQLWMCVPSLVLLSPFVGHPSLSPNGIAPGLSLIPFS